MYCIVISDPVSVVLATEIREDSEAKLDGGVVLRPTEGLTGNPLFFGGHRDAPGQIAETNQGYYHLVLARNAYLTSFASS